MIYNAGIMLDIFGACYRYNIIPLILQLYFFVLLQKFCFGKIKEKSVRLWNCFVELLC